MQVGRLLCRRDLVCKAISNRQFLRCLGAGHARFRAAIYASVRTSSRGARRLEIAITWRGNTDIRVLLPANSGAPEQWPALETRFSAALAISNRNSLQFRIHANPMKTKAGRFSNRNKKPVFGVLLRCTKNRREILHFVQDDGREALEAGPSRLRCSATSAGCALARDDNENRGQKPQPTAKALEAGPSRLRCSAASAGCALARDDNRSYGAANLRVASAGFAPFRPTPSGVRTNCAAAQFEGARKGRLRGTRLLRRRLGRARAGDWGAGALRSNSGGPQGESRCCAIRQQR